jgi:SnoaL-like domain
VTTPPAPASLPAEARTDVAGLVDAYLQLCEDRDLETATTYLSPDVRLQFPGGEEYRSLTEMAASSGGKYRWVRKRRDRSAVGTQDGRTTVTSIGTLYGERLDGTPFEGIRYVDVFVLDGDGLIAEQLVWNDLAIAGIVPLPD